MSTTKNEGGTVVVASTAAGIESGGTVQASTEAQMESTRTLNVRAFFPDSEIYSSGVITIRDVRQPLTIQILPETGNPYDVKITFSYIEGKDSSVDWGVAERGLNIDIINFDSPLGLTMHYPVPLGTYGGRSLLLDFVVYTLGDQPASAPKLFCYTLRASSPSDG